MKKKDLIKLLLHILEDWANDSRADLDGPNSYYHEALVQLLKEEEK